MIMLPFTWSCYHCSAAGRTVDVVGAVGAVEHHIRRYHAGFGRYMITYRSWGGLRSCPLDGTVVPDADRPGWAVIA